MCCLVTDLVGPSSVFPMDGDRPTPAELVQPVAGELAAAWEDVRLLRRRVKDKNMPYFTRWINKDAIQIPSVRAMVLNHEALLCMATWWCPTKAFPKFIPIDLVRAEVGLWKKQKSRVLILDYLAVRDLRLFWNKDCFGPSRGNFILLHPERSNNSGSLLMLKRKTGPAYR